MNRDEISTRNLHHIIITPVRSAASTIDTNHTGGIHGMAMIVHGRYLQVHQERTQTHTPSNDGKTNATRL